MIYLETGSTDPYFNMAFEEYVFEKLDRSKQYFMLWQNNNAIIVGKYQNTIEEIDSLFVKNHDIQVVRRNSGGGAVYHDLGNLNFTFIVDCKNNTNRDFKLFTIPVINALKELGLNVELTTRNDITIEGKKFSGNSQCIKNGRLLHHGTIMLDTNLDIIDKALIKNQKNISSKSVKSVISRVTNIAPYLKMPITMEELKETLKSNIFKNTEFTTGNVTEEDIAAICDLCDKKYATWEWNYGFSPAFDLKKEREFPAGRISVYILANKGCISQINLRGDFFANDNISVLENALIGVPIGKELMQRLISYNAGNLIRGISAEDLYDLIFY